MSGYPICDSIDCPVPPVWLIRCKQCGTPQGRRCIYHVTHPYKPYPACARCGHHAVEKRELGT